MSNEGPASYDGVDLFAPSEARSFSNVAQPFTAASIDAMRANLKEMASRPYQPPRPPPIGPREWEWLRSRCLITADGIHTPAYAKFLAAGFADERFTDEELDAIDRCMAL